MKKILLFILLLFVSTMGFASHYMGGEITYHQTGPLTYTVRLSLYRDCTGIDLDASATLEYESVSCGLSGNITVDLINNYPQDITPLCPGALSACNGEGGPFGVEVFIYEGVLQLPQACSDWYIYFESSARNNIDNIVSGSGISFYTMLNNQAVANNNSPSFANDPAVYLCVNQEINYNHGVIELDGDQLVFSINTCYDNFQVPVSYIAPFDPLHPIATVDPPGMTIDPATGAISFTPNSVMVGIVCVLVQEYRNGVLIGEIMRDIQITVQNCQNTNPILSGIDGNAGPGGITGGTTLTTCPNQQVCMNFDSYDADGDAITIFFDQSLPGATFQQIGNSATLCWTPTANDVGLHIFTMIAQDNSCPLLSSNTYTYTVNVVANQNPPVNAGLDQTICTGASATLTATCAAGNVASYSWSPQQGLANPNSPTTAASPTITTTYFVTIIYNDGCSSVDNLTVSVLPPPPATITASDNFLCPGQSAVLSVPNGAATYAWSLNGQNAGAGPSITVTPMGLGNFTYQVTVTSNNGCTATSSVTIQVGGAQAAVTNTGPYCSGETINLSANGGVSYLWTGPGGFASTNATPSLANANAAMSGNYSVTLTDANGCSATGQTSVTVYAPLTPNVATVAPVLCAGGATGSIDLSVSGGNGIYSYAWLPIFQNVQDPTGLSAGVYDVTVTDGIGCSASLSGIQIMEPTPLTIQVINLVDVDCFGNNTGELTIEVTGGVAPYHYQWSNGSQTPQLVGIAAGNYTVTASDENGCSQTLSASVSEPQALTVTLGGKNDVTCFGAANGWIDVIFGGGSGPFNFLWSNGMTTEDISGLAPGIYGVTLTDAHGCTAALGGLAIAEPMPLGIALDAFSDVICYGNDDAWIATTLTGGTLPYSYYWNNGATTEDLSGLAPGGYSLMVSDGNGCSASLSGITISQPDALVLTISSFSHVPCYGDCNAWVNTTAAGGVQPYGYSWSNGALTPSIESLCPDTYTLVLNDDNGCTAEVTQSITEPLRLIVSQIGETDVRCFEACDGSADVQTDGGTAPYLYQWSDGATTEDQDLLCPGVYNVTVTDDHGCTASYIDIEITEPSELVAQVIELDHVHCFNACDASLMVGINGGTPPYEYVWDNGIAEALSLTHLCVGEYTLYGTDSNGCTFSVNNVIITQPDPLRAYYSHTDASCPGSQDAILVIDSITGGTTPYSFEFDHGNVTQNVQNGFSESELGAATYTLTMRDSQNCLVEDSVRIAEPYILVTAGPDLTIYMGDTIALQAAILTAHGPMVFHWSPFEGMDCDTCVRPKVHPLERTTFIFEVEDLLTGCPFLDTMVVMVNKGRKVFIPTVFSPNDDGINDLFTVYCGNDVVKVNKIQVFDTWGEQLYEATDVLPNAPDVGWDGTLRGSNMNPATFLYHIEVSFLDGKVLSFTGTFLLVR